MHTVSQLIDARADIGPQKIAVIDRGGVWTYAELAAESRRLAGGLLKLGIGLGDRVGFWLPNIAQYLTLHIACARIGAITVSINTRYRSSEVGDIVGRSGCRALVLWPSFKDIAFLDILAEVDRTDLEQLEFLITYSEGEQEIQLPGRLLSQCSVPYTDLARSEMFTSDGATAQNGVVVFTTSGTTAAPKFVLHSQASISHHAHDVASFFDWNEPDAVLLQVLPLCGTFGHAGAMAALSAGCPMVLMPAFSDHEAVQLMQSHRITHCNGSDEMFARMLVAADDPYPFPLFRSGGYAAFNPLYQDIVARAHDRGMNLVGLYGMSEIQALYARQDPLASVERRGRCGGYPASTDSQVRVRDPESKEILPHGQVGELEATGPSRMIGYLDDATATESVFTSDGFVRSGDLGYTESDGGFVFLGRMGDAIRLGGFLVNPVEIEQHIEQHPAVERVQVVAVDTQAGTRAYAFVIPAENAPLHEDALLAHCASGMASFKVPIGVQL
ncbi:MAG: AMP-binding protein, partial [Arenicellales bacterium]|nr:AMP-binding protein [Arenicellales bacterium]